MELRSQDKETGLGYNPQIFSTAGERTGNGAPILSRSQTLDHHHHHHQPQSQGRDPDSDPDPVPVSIAVVAGATDAPPIAGGSSNPRTPPKTTSLKNIISIRYRKCLKNHAASVGGHVIDGCGEFMPSGEDGNPEALRCAACNCHRNFHRKEVDGEPQSLTNSFYYKNNTNRSRVHLPFPPPPPLLHQHQKFHLGPSSTSPSTAPIPPVTMAFVGSGGGATQSSSEDLNVYQSNAAGAPPLPPPPHPVPFVLSKKRFRTKFTQDQKEKMLGFAEKVGWRIQKQDEPEVQQLCAEVGIKRQVLKVWMHNNKHSMKKKQM